MSVGYGPTSDHGIAFGLAATGLLRLQADGLLQAQIELVYAVPVVTKPL